MNTDEVRNAVQEELNAIAENKADIQKTIIDPSKERFETMEGDSQDLWIVGKKDEFFLVMDENKNTFGLAFKNIVNEMVYLGDEGSLAEAYEALISREGLSDEKPARAAKKKFTHRRFKKSR